MSTIQHFTSLTAPQLIFNLKTKFRRCSTRSCSFSLHHWGRWWAESRAVCLKISARRRRRNCSLGAKADLKEASSCKLWSQQLSRLSRCDSSFLSGFSVGRILCLPRSTDTDTAGGELTAAVTGKYVNAVSFVFISFSLSLCVIVAFYDGFHTADRELR